MYPGLLSATNARMTRPSTTLARHRDAFALCCKRDVFKPFSGAYPPLTDITAQNIAAVVLEGLTARHAACNRVTGLSWRVRSGASDKGTLQRLDRGLLIH
jgi:hypothetical protein